MVSSGSEASTGTTWASRSEAASSDADSLSGNGDGSADNADSSSEDDDAPAPSSFRIQQQRSTGFRGAAQRGRSATTLQRGQRSIRARSHSRAALHTASNAPVSNKRRRASSAGGRQRSGSASTSNSSDGAALGNPATVHEPIRFTREVFLTELAKVQAEVKVPRFTASRFACSRTGSHLDDRFLAGPTPQSCTPTGASCAQSSPERGSSNRHSSVWKEDEEEYDGYEGGVHCQGLQSVWMVCV